MIKKLSTYQDYLSFLNRMNDKYYDLFKYHISSPDKSKALFKMIFLDVDSIRGLLGSLYPAIGRPAKNQMEIFRCLVLMLHFKCTSFKLWAQRLKTDPLLAILCGFEIDDTPSFSSLYDFSKRLYFQEVDNIKSPGFFNSNYQKPEGKHEKLVNYDKNAVRSIIRDLEENGVGELPEDNLLNIFQKVAVNFSKKVGMIDDKMVISGDGSAWATHASPYGKRISDTQRRYSEMDSDRGYDSDLEVFYFGFTEYNISVINRKFKIDLPVFLTMAKASQHDALTSIKSLATFFSINNSFDTTHVCLDCASDNYDTHWFLLNSNITPIIDINKRRSNQNIYESFKDISENGRPICIGGYEMAPYGRDL